MFQQLYVRQALQEGIDQIGIVDTLFHHLAVAETGQLVAKPSTPFYDPQLNKVLYPYDPARGKTLLEKHGWHLSHGVMTKDGVKLAFTFDYASGDTTYTDIAQLFKQGWAQEGIQVTLKSLPVNNVLTLTEGYSWNMALWCGGTPSWTYVPDYFPSGTGLFTQGGAANPGDYYSGKMTAILNQGMSPAERAVCL